MNRWFRDADIRPALHRLVTQDESADTVVIEELGLAKGSVRVDLAVVNGILHAYEIKSDFDSLRRLAMQADHYSRCFDRVTLVCGQKLLSGVRQHVPKWWGLMQVSAGPSGPVLRSIRRGRMNPRRDPRALVELLWRDTTLALLEQIGAAKGLRSKPRDALWDVAARMLSLDEIADAVKRHLKANSAKLGLSAR